jgi:Bacterial archaeo-eukaryotic release factor family 3
MKTQITPGMLGAFNALCEDGAAVCLSILIPTDARTPTPKRDALVFKNALRTAARRLQASGMAQHEAEAFVQPLRELSESGQLWSERSLGLAVFSAGQPESTLYFHLPFTVPEVVIAGKRFYYKPLLAALHSTPRFFTLALSLKGAQLHEFNAGAERLVPLPGVPRGVAGMPAHEDLDAQRHARSFTRNTARGPLTSHSHGAGDIDHEARNTRYFQRVAQAVAEALADDSAPLVLAGVERDVAQYRAANTYAHLAPDAIIGSPLLRTAGDLRTEAASLLAGLMNESAVRALARYREANNTPRVTRSAKAIVRAAHDGRIDTLFVAQDFDKWGRFDPGTYHVRIHPLPQPGDVSLLNLAAEYTLRHHGQVFLLPRAKLPRSAPMAAILRR